MEASKQTERSNIQENLKEIQKKNKTDCFPPGLLPLHSIKLVNTNNT